MFSKIFLENGKSASGKTLQLLIENGRISAINGPKPSDAKVINCHGNLILPGIIDAHTHIRDMGLSYKEDWLSASKAAVSSGITTIFDMPNTKPATFDCVSLEEKRKAAQKSIANTGYNFGVTEYNAEEIRKAAPIAALKMFMAESSSGYVVENEETVRAALMLAKEINKPIMVHSELQSCVEEHEKKYEPLIANHNQIRNPICAIKATERLIKLAEETGAEVYIAHVSLKEEIEMIRKAKKHGKARVYCEITPHHLFIDETILQKVGNYGKVNPPLRTAEDCAALLEAIIDGTADTIGTDHAPHGLAEKNEAYPTAPSGFPGLETSLGLMLQLVQQKKIDLERLEQLMCGNPAKIFNIKQRGKIEVGMHADLAIVDLDKEWEVDPAHFFSKAKYAPYTGMKLKGKCITTLVNGQVVWDGKNIHNIKGKEVAFT